MFDLRGSRVLVAGGTGFIGTNLLHELLSMDVRIRSTYHSRKPKFTDDRIKYVQCDLQRTDDCLKAVKGIDVVFMCAAVTSGAAAILSNPLQHVTPNIVMNARILEASYLSHVRKLVWISSSVVYPLTGRHPNTEDEGFQGDPYDTYFEAGWMKRYTEILCRLYSQKLRNPLPCVVLRPTNVYGPYDKFEPDTSHVTAALVRKVVERQNPLVVWGNGKDVKDVIYIDDLIDAMILAVQKLDFYQPLNIGSGEGYTVKEILDTLLELDGFAGAKVVFDRSRRSMVPIRLVNTQKAKQLLGFTPKIGLREGLSRTLRWYRNSKKLL